MYMYIYIGDHRCVYIYDIEYIHIAIIDKIQP